MTVSTDLNRKQYAGNGVTTSFATSPVVFFDSTDLDVYVVTTATGAATLLTETTDYTVTGGAGSTGTVSTAGLYGAPSASQTLVIVRNVPLTQATDFVQNDASDAEVVEDALDKLTMAVQQVGARVDRSFTLADSDVSGASTELPTPVASRLLGWDSGGTALQNYAASDLSAVVTTAFTESLLDDGSAGVFLETLYQAATADTAPAINDYVFVRNTSNTAGRVTTWQNALKVINSLSRDSAPDRTADYLLSYDASASAVKKVLFNDFPFGRMFISGLTYANNGSDATNDIDIAAGSCRDATDAVNVVLASTLTKQSDAAWAVGSAAGGLDTGVVGNSDYYIWLIKRSDTGVVDALFSLSSTAPTMPTNYDYKRLIGWFKRSGGAIVAFSTFELDGGGIELSWTAPTRDVNLSNTLTTSRRTDALKVPLDFSTFANISVYINDAASAAAIYVWSTTITDAAPDGAPENTNITYPTPGIQTSTELWVRTSAAGLIAARASIATVDQYQVATKGFRWARRN